MVVFKDDTPVCVLVEPRKYDAMVEALQDCALCLEALERDRSASVTTTSHESMLSELDVDAAALAETVVEIE